MSNRIYGYVGVSSPSEENNSSLESQKKELILYGVKESKIIIRSLIMNRNELIGTVIGKGLAYTVKGITLVKLSQLISPQVSIKF